MSNEKNRAVRILTLTKTALEASKNEEYAYWQGKTPLERLLATQELSFAFFGELNEAETRQQFLRAPHCLPFPWS